MGETHDAVSVEENFRETAATQRSDRPIEDDQVALYGRIGREHARMPDPRGFPKGPRARDIVDPYLHLDAIKVKTRDFR